ncbi:GIY-YIG nuclease family protein [Agarilytica rhodophyticola]|uniref:GIY-YIG nuclease family protein n=1 Tax=Agarilytica rhodophyticola TaxID=1737490 RepID=UPI000B34763C|nr:GIY-YIG nuclease family protein [Agarilytica rhodophyticola]
MAWFVYIVECVDTSFYAGITTDIDRRLHEHNEKKSGARYTRAKRPVKLVYSEAMENRSEASKREYAIKQMTRKQKEQIIAQYSRLKTR